jgi:hypothetical protein
MDQLVGHSLPRVTFDEGSRPVSLVTEAVLDAPVDKVFGSHERLGALMRRAPPCSRCEYCGKRARCRTGHLARESPHRRWVRQAGCLDLLIALNSGIQACAPSTRAKRLSFVENAQPSPVAWREPRSPSRRTPYCPDKCACSRRTGAMPERRSFRHARRSGNLSARYASAVMIGVRRAACPSESFAGSYCRSPTARVSRAPPLASWSLRL